MIYTIVRTQEEIDDCLNAAEEAEIEGSRWPGMSYEQGVQAAILWLTYKEEPSPMEDD